MHIVIPGGSGQVGTFLARAFVRDGHHVTVLSRSAASTTDWQTVVWDGKSLGDWAGVIDGCDVVLNLAGRTVNCRYTAENQAQMMDSRVESTRVVGQAIAQAVKPPRVWLQSSTATIYAHRFDEANDEATGIIGNRSDAPAKWAHSTEIAKAWERTQDEAHTPQTRKVALRAAVIMSPDADGIFDTLLGLVRVGLGGTSGSGKQYVSWIHELDFVNAVYWLIEREHLEGAVNLASPNPLPNKAFMRAIREAWGTRIGLPATEWMLEIGAVFMRTETELLLKSRRVVPTRLVEDGFVFAQPEWGPAAKELVGRWRQR